VRHSIYYPKIGELRLEYRGYDAKANICSVNHISDKQLESLYTPTPEKMGRGVGYLTLMNLINLGVTLLFYLALARILSESAVGEVALILLILSVFNSATLLALPTAATKFIAENLGSKNLSQAGSAFSSTIKLLTFISVPALIGVSVFLPYIAKVTNLSPTVLLVTLAASFLLDYTNVLGGAFFGLSMFKEASIQSLLFTVFSRLPAIVFARVLGVEGVALGFLMGAALSLLYSFLRIRGRFAEVPSKRLYKPLISYSAPLYGLALIALGQTWLSIAVLYGITHGLSTTGIYYLVAQSASVLAVLYSPITQVLFPALSYRKGGGGTEAVESVLKNAEKITIFVVGPLSLAIAAASPTALSVVFGANYSHDSLAFTILSVSTIPTALAGLYLIALQSIGETRPVLWVGATTTAVNTALLSVLVPSLVATGAASSTLVTSLINVTLSYHFVSKKLGHRFGVAGKTMAFSVLVGLAVYVTQLLTGSSGLVLKAELDALLFFVSFVLLSKIVRPLGEEDRQILRRVLRGKSGFIEKLI
jgi:O-antigen/teichoic acid export membrane protein